MGSGHQLNVVRGRAGLSLVSLVSLLPLPACHHDAPDATAVADGGSAAAVQVPSDRLAKNELVEGQVKAFALPLPLGMNITLRLDKTIDAQGVAQQKQVTSFFQARVLGGKLFPGGHMSDFRGVHTAAEPNRPLNIHVEQFKTTQLTSVEVVDVTPNEAGVTPPDQAYRANGISADNKLVDPNHMQ